MLITPMVLVALAAAQEADPGRFVEELGDPEPSVRESAQECLRRIGQRALEPLLKAARDSDKERALRAMTLIEEIDCTLRGRIACWRPRASGAEIVVLDPAAGANPRVFGVQAPSGYGPAEHLDLHWVPGAEFLLLVARYPDAGKFLSERESALLGWRLRLKDGDAHCFAPSGELCTLSDSAGSPAGQLSVFTTGREQIELLDLGRQALRPLRTPGFRPRWPTWSPDGKTLAFEMHKNGTYVVDVALQKVQRISGRSLMHPLFSGSGDAILGLVEASERRTFDVAKIERATGNFRVLMEDVRSEALALSPSGRFLAYEKERRRAEVEIMVLDLENNLETVIGLGEHPTWSPNSRLLAFERIGRIVIAHVGMNSETEVADGQCPSWSRPEVKGK